MIKPTFDNILVDPLEQEGQTESGIYLPDTAKEKPSQGKVLAVGPGIKYDGKTVDMPVKAGDAVIYKKWGGHEVKDQGKTLLLVEAKDILAVIGDK